jgi:hypothetical protein
MHFSLLLCVLPTDGWYREGCASLNCEIKPPTMDGDITPIQLLWSINHCMVATFPAGTTTTCRGDSGCRSSTLREAFLCLCVVEFYGCTKSSKLKFFNYVYYWQLWHLSHSPGHGRIQRGTHRVVGQTFQAILHLVYSFILCVFKRQHHKIFFIQQVIYIPERIICL